MLRTTWLWSLRILMFFPISLPVSSWTLKASLPPSFTNLTEPFHLDVVITIVAKFRQYHLLNLRNSICSRTTKREITHGFCPVKVSAASPSSWTVPGIQFRTPVPFWLGCVHNRHCPRPRALSSAEGSPANCHLCRLHGSIIQSSVIIFPCPEVPSAAGNCRLLRGVDGQAGKATVADGQRL